MNSAHSRTGWQEEETHLLKRLVEECVATGQPLRAAFDRVAAQTGRKGNSVRNYYYAACREGILTPIASGRRAPAQPFDTQEMEHLVRSVLSARKQGISVRSCTMNMAGGDKSGALRLQNKYRSLLRARPDWVAEIAREMDADLPQPAKPVSAANQTQELVRLVSEILTDIKQVDGLDAAHFLGAMASLCRAAATQPSVRRRAQMADGLRARLDLAAMELEDKEKELQQLRDQVNRAQQMGA
nr:hypothetical protein [bacterium]